jgi:hypothetical protein
MHPLRWLRRRRANARGPALLIGSVASGIAADAAAVALAGLPWRHTFFAEIAKFPLSVLAAHYPNVPNLGDMTRITDQQLENACGSTSFSAEHPVSPSALPASEVEWLTRVVSWPLSSADLLSAQRPAGSSGKTSPVLSRQIAEKPSEASSLRWTSSGTVWRGACSMRSISDSPNAGSASFLSDILETGDLPRRYFLSPRACRGILKRASRRGRVLPAALTAALEAVASLALSEPPEATDEGTE